MDKLTFEEFEQKLADVEVIEPDEWDKDMLAEIDLETDETTVSLNDFRVYKNCRGILSLRIPKELHYILLKNAKNNGVSLNQYALYKLAK